MYRLDRLLERDRDEHAEHDHAYLADELTPAVEWLGKVDMHATRALSVTVA